VIADVEAGGLRLFEAMTLAWLGGWATSHARLSTPLQVPSTLRLAALLLLTAALVSSAVTASLLLAEDAGTVRAGLASGGLFDDYAVTWNALSTAMLLPQGVLLMLGVADVAAPVARRAGVLRMMAVGAAVAALFNVLRIVTASLAREAPWAAFVEFATSLRVNVHHGDWNAAGSYFAMALFLAAGVAVRERRIGLPCALLAAAGLWLSGSRTALAAAFLTAAAAALLALRQRGHRRAALAIAGLGIVAVGAALWILYPAGRNADASLALQIRMALARAALAMTADYPWFGIGLGRFFELSRPYTHLPVYIVNENAHNNFLQVLAELGITGLVLFVGVLGLALAGAGRAATRSEWAIFAGPIVFLVTCLGGHPLLVAHAAYPFWMALGLASALSPIDGVPRAARAATAVLVVALTATLPFRAAAALRTADLAGTSAGLSRWQREPDGSRYRWAGGRSTFHVPASARWVRLSLQHGSSGPDTIEVRILLNGREADRVLLRKDEGWRSVRLVPGRTADSAFSRIDLEAWEKGGSGPIAATPTDTGGVLKVGRPVVEE
jgi:O-antigen ligase